MACAYSPSAWEVETGGSLALNGQVATYLRSSRSVRDPVSKKKEEEGRKEGNMDRLTVDGV